MSVSVADQGVIFPRREFAYETFPGLSTTHLYLAPSNANADDNNPGNDPDMPLATLNGVIERLNLLARITSAVIVHMESGTYTWGVTLGPIALSAPLVFYGDGGGQDGDDGFVEITAAAAAAAGTGQRVIVNPTGGITVNGLVGKTIQVLSGAAEGDLRTIRSNTDDDLIPNRAFTAAPAQGDSFRLVEPGVVINCPLAVSLFATPPMVLGVGAAYDIASPVAAGTGAAFLLLANMAIQRTPGDASFPAVLFAQSAVALAGVELQGDGSQFVMDADEVSSVVAGQDLGVSTVVSAFRAPFVLGLADSVTSWAGWGLSSLSQALMPRFRRFAGYLNVVVTTVSASLTSGARWHLVGGSIIGTGTSAPSDEDGLWNIQGSQVTIRAFDTTLPFLVTAVGQNNRGAAIRATAGGILSAIGLEARITSFGAAIVAHGSETSTSPALQAGIVSLVSSITLEAPYAGVVAMTGGRIYFDVDPTVAGTMTAGQAIITQSSTGGAAVAASTFAAFTDGSVIYNPDGSGTVIGQIT